MTSFSVSCRQVVRGAWTGRPPPLGKPLAYQMLPGNSPTLLESRESLLCTTKYGPGYRAAVRHAAGKGEIEVYPVFAPAALGGKCRLFARLIIRKGCSIGVHRHHKEREVVSFRKLPTLKYTMSTACSLASAGSRTRAFAGYASTPRVTKGLIAASNSACSLSSNSRTGMIFRSLPAFAPTKANPCFSLPFFAFIRAWAMQ